MEQSTTRQKRTCKACRHCKIEPTLVSKAYCLHPNALADSEHPLTLQCRLAPNLCGMEMRWFEPQVK
jgi:hypothetical protein